MSDFKRYFRAPDSVSQIVKNLVADHYEDLKENDVTFDIIFCNAPLDKDGNPNGPAITHHGSPALGLAYIVPEKDRAMDRADAEIRVDSDSWPNWNEEQRKAILDHELYHFLVHKDKEGETIKDTNNRPKLKMRPHDFEFGWFTEIAERYGKNSMEIKQAQEMYDRAGEILFADPEDQLVSG